jgi:hypothetical protein
MVARAKRGEMAKIPRLSVTLTPAEREGLRLIAQAEKRSDSFIAAMAIRHWLQIQASSRPGLLGQTRLDLPPSNPLG